MKRSFLTVLVFCVFVCCSPLLAATSYGVAGSFDSWNPADPASQLNLADGLWSLETFLHAGVLEYKFVADHAWQVNWGDDWMAAVAYNLLWIIRGIPCLYYGEEISFMRGAPQDICGNDYTLDTTGCAYFGDNLVGTALAKTKAHPLYQHIKRLNCIRRQIPALQKAPMGMTREWGSGMSFVRDYNSGQSYVAVGLAAGNGQDVTVVGVRNGLYRDAVTGNNIQVGNGAISFHVKGNSAGIYVLNGPGKIGEDGVYLR